MVATLLLIAGAQSRLAAAMADPALSGAVAGVCVTRLDGTVVFSRLADTRLTPASNQKLLTAVFAAATLGMDFKPRTRFWKLDEGIYVDAPGDPTLTMAELLTAKEALAANPGPVRVRQAYSAGVPPTWEYDDLPNRYAARVASFSFDRGGFEVWSKDGAVAPLDPAYRIEVRHEPGSGTAKVEYDMEKRLAVVRGTLPVADKMIEAFAVPDPDVTAALLLGGELVNAAEPPPAREPDFVIEGEPLRSTLKTCLEKSDNNMAEQLLLIAAGKGKPLGDNPYAEAAKRLEAFLFGTVKLRKGSVKPVDGSGMSRQDMVSPSAMCRLLRWAYRQSWREDFLAALAEPGEGTLESRLKSRSFFGKTGTLSAVTCLSGYVKTASGQTLVVSMLFNNTVASASEVRAVQDRIVTILARS